MIRRNYDFLYVCVPLMGEKRLIGEIDVYAVKGSEIDLYEVKCSYREKKARKQLTRAKKFLKLDDKCRTFFYCGESGLLVGLD